MKIEELPEETRDEIRSLKHGSYTIETDVIQALEDAGDIKDFKQGVTGRMKALIEEAEGVISSLGTAEMDKVQVVIHLHSGVIFNTAVFRDAEKAKKHRDELVIQEYGELVESQEGDDTIDLQTCQVIV